MFHKSCYHILAAKKSLGVDINAKAPPNVSVLSAVDKNKKQAEKHPRPGDFDYILEADTYSNMVTEKYAKVCNKFSEKFVTMRGNTRDGLYIEKTHGE